MGQAKKKIKLFDERYEILSIVGRGTRSVVYHARNINNPEADLALKVLLSRKEKDIDLGERLRKEALALVSGRHEHVVRLDDFHSLDDLCYLALEYAPYGDLRKYIEETDNKLHIKSAELYLTQIAEAVSFLHQIGMIHRDIKPDNILMTSSERVVLADFGVAVLPGEKSSLEELQRGIGTMDYMAPEVLEGVAYDERSDVYSLGITFYELITGKHPFRNAPMVKQLDVRRNENLQPIEMLASKIPEYLASAIMQAMSFNASDRFPSASEFLEALKIHQAQGTPIESSDSEKEAEKPKKKKRRRRRRRKKKKTEATTPEKVEQPVSPAPAPSDPTAGEKELSEDDDDEFLKELDREIDRLLKDDPDDFLSDYDPLKDDEDLFKFDDLDSKSSSPEDLSSDPFDFGNDDIFSLDTEKKDSKKEEPFNLDSFNVPQSIPDSDEPEEIPSSHDFSGEPSQSFPSEEGTLIVNQAEPTEHNDNEQPAEVVFDEDEFLLDDTPFRFRPLLTLTVIAFAGYLLWGFLSGSGEDSNSTRVQQTELGAISSGLLLTDISEEGNIRFPFLPAGAFHGFITGVIPGAESPLTFISHPEENLLIVFIGIDGWKPVRISLAEYSEKLKTAEEVPPLRINSNGYVLELYADGSDTLNGSAENIMAGRSGQWSVSALGGRS